MERLAGQETRTEQREGIRHGGWLGIDYGANSAGDEMERVISTLRASLDVECPKCENMFDAFDQDDGGNIMNPIFNNGWDKLIGCELTCPECGEDIELTGVEW